MALMKTALSGTSKFLAHKYGAEAGQPLEEHLLAVSRMAGRSAMKLGLPCAGALIGLLHDFGKYSSIFQNYLLTVSGDQDTEPADMTRGSVDHSTAGAQFIWNRLATQGDLKRVVGEILSLCIASHHSGLIDCISPEGENVLIKRMKKDASQTHLYEAEEHALAEVKKERERLLESPELVAEICRLAESICRRERCESKRQFQLGMVVKFLLSVLIDADRTDTASSSGRETEVQRSSAADGDWSGLLKRLEDYLRHFPNETRISRLRKQVSDECWSAADRPTGIYTLTVPTGGGKTLASLRFALRHAETHGMDRVIYVSPYTSIIDQNAAVVRQILESNDERGTVVVEHHSNLTPERQTEINKALSENWDAPVVFTTAVQFLEAVFGAGTRAARRMHRLANAVVVFDEIQTLPTRCIHLFNNAANFLAEQARSTLVLCTATQPPLGGVSENKGAIRIGGAEIIQNVSALFHGLRRNELVDGRKPQAWTHSDVAELAIAEVDRAGSCVVVVNTKAEAREVFRHLGDDAAIKKFHLSTAMCPAHRVEKLNRMRELLERGDRVACVSTQLIEAGVDISFGAAIRALAGLDSVAQTAGRCNRHGERDSGRVTLINLTTELPGALREIREGQRAALRTIQERLHCAHEAPLDLGDPSLVETFFSYFFHELRKEMDYPVSTKEIGREDTILRMLSGNEMAAISGGAGSLHLRQSFMSAARAFEAIPRETRGIVVPYNREARTLIGRLCASTERFGAFGLLREAQRFSVNVFPQAVSELDRAGAIAEAVKGSGVLYLAGPHYTDDLGLSMENIGEM